MVRVSNWLCHLFSLLGTHLGLSRPSSRVQSPPTPTPEQPASVIQICIPGRATFPGARSLITVSRWQTGFGGTFHSPLRKKKLQFAPFVQGDGQFIEASNK